MTVGSRPPDTGEAPVGEKAPGPPPPHRALTVPLTMLIALFLVGTSRWGSYLGIPGAPFYISDVFVALALLQVAVLMVRRQISLSRLTDAPLALLLVTSLLLYASVRLFMGLTLSTDVLRDFAPYGYAVVAAIGFLLPVREETRWRPVIYGVLAAHVAWVVLLPQLPGFPWQLPALGSDATLLVPRPDFDTAVLGIGAALALSDLLLNGRRRPVVSVALAGFAVLSIAGMTTLSTRAGLIGGVLAIVSVVVAWLTRRWHVGSPVAVGSTARVRSVVAVVLALGALASALVLTPTGGRLVDGLDSTSSEAYGTIAVRKTVWAQVNRYVLHDVGRTSIGVGFGPNFIEDSGSRAALEGSTYQNVRSPHNYVLGTFARLGAAGALLVTLIIVLAGWMGISALRRGSGPVTTLAALLVVALPVTALLGVVLEAPFGAITYFWAIGQLSFRAMDTRRDAAKTTVREA